MTIIIPRLHDETGSTSARQARSTSQSGKLFQYSPLLSQLYKRTTCVRRASFVV